MDLATPVRERSRADLLSAYQAYLAERDHTKILLGAAEHFGLEVDGTFDPPGAMVGAIR